MAGQGVGALAPPPQRPDGPPHLVFHLEPQLDVGGVLALVDQAPGPVALDRWGPPVQGK